jgi:Rad4 beta-hairpin domain 1/Rad4 beta-hairpin domain 3/Rad4 beta-hairpin domain 2
MSLDWNLSSDDNDDDEDGEDDFEHWAQGQHQQLLSTAARITSKEGDDDDDDDDDDEDMMDRKPAAVEEQGIAFVVSDFDRALPPSPQGDDDTDNSEDEVDWEDAEEAEDEVQQQQQSTPFAKLPSEAITLDFNSEPADDETKKQKKKIPKRITVKKVFRYQHLPPDLQGFLHHIRKVHLMCWSSHAMSASQYASQDECLHLSHSVLPRAWAMPKQTTAHVVAPTVPDVHHFVQWFGDYVSGGSAQTDPAIAMGLGRRRIMRNRHGKVTSTMQKSSAAKRKRSVMEEEEGGADRHQSTIQYRIPQLCSDLSQPGNRSSACNEYDKILLFLSMARSMGWRARYVVAVEPIPQDLEVNHPLFEVMTHRNIFLGLWNAANKKRKAAANPIDLTGLDDENGHDDDDKRSKDWKQGSNKGAGPVSSDAEIPPKPLCWIEILCQSPSTNKKNDVEKPALHWIHVDPVLGIVNRPALVEQQLYAHHQRRSRSLINGRKRAAVPYAVAVEHFSIPNMKEADQSSSLQPILRMTDVTPRYAYSIVESLQARGMGQEKQPESAKDDWFSTFLRQHGSYGSKRRKNAEKDNLSLKMKTTDDAIILDDGVNAGRRENTKANVVTPEPQISVAGATHLHHYHMEPDEEKQLDSMKKQEPLPTSKAAFKKHPTYVIASCLNSTEVLVPDAKKRSCGIFKGELVFLRSDVETALPEKKWLYQGRKVRKEELKRPILKVKARKKATGAGFKALKTYGVGSSNDGSEEAIEKQIYDASQPLGDGKVHLFGSWQTDPWSPEVVGPNDDIPVNDYDNVELELLNPGLVHIDLRGVAKTAKKLSIPYKPCLIGFEGHGGNRTPTIRGIVVHAHNETLLRDAHTEVSHHLQKKEEENKNNAILRRWKRLMVGVLTMDRLERSYGHDDDEK